MVDTEDYILVSDVVVVPELSAWCTLDGKLRNLS